MKAVSFELSGKTACFRKPDVNQFAYFTYNNIHKPALLGILGAILGLGGYNQLSAKNRQIEEFNKGKKKKEKQELDSGFPEFYVKLKDLKVSIIPLAPHGYFSKKIQVFNNSTMYVNKDKYNNGANLVVREQWLEKPKWQIMILDNGSDKYAELKEYLLDGKCEFIPYLGKNDHPAKIDKPKEVKLDEVYLEEGNYMDSLFIKQDEINGFEKEGEMPFVFQEVSPMRLQEEFHFYEYETLCFTNCELEEMPEDSYSFNQKNYAFF